MRDTGVIQSGDARAAAGQWAMRACLLLLIGSAALWLGGCANRPQHQAWCTVFNGDSGVNDCGYATWQQCQATVSGVGGFCERNPHYRYYARHKAYRRHR